MMRLTRKHPRDPDRPARDVDHDPSADLVDETGWTHAPDGRTDGHLTDGPLTDWPAADWPMWRDPSGPTGATEAAVRRRASAHTGHGGAPGQDRATPGIDTDRPDPGAPAFRRGGMGDTGITGRAGPSGHGARAQSGPRGSARSENTASGRLPGTSAFPTPGRDTSRPDPTAAHDRLGHSVLGAGWVGGDLSALDHAVHPAACLRTGPAVATGPGAIMAAALADLGAYDHLAYFPENTLVSTTAVTDLCPDTLAAMTVHHAPTDGAILSLRGSLTGRTPRQGAVTGARDIRQRVMADLWCGDGQVLDGWILRDTGGALAQAGGPHPADWARARLRAAGGPDRMPPPLTPDTDPDGPYIARSPRSRRCDWGEALADRLRRVMDGDLATLDRGSDPACEHVLPGAVTGLGAGPARVFWAGLRAALPSAAFRIEHRHGAAHPNAAPQAAVRWSLYGRHDGTGRFGAPTGCFIHVAGMTQVEFGPRGVRRDWTVIDDCAVWTQIVMATGHV